MIELTGKKYVVTGGAGFVGGHICEELVKQGKEVICIDNDVSKKPVEGVTFKRCDVSYNPLAKVFKGADVVFHNAASKCTVCLDNPLKDLMINAWGTFRVAQAAEKVGAKLVHASTGSVYGNCMRQSEEIQYAPRSFYGVSKLAGEQYLRCFPGLRWVGLRYFHVYGPRQDSSDRGGVIPIFIRRMLAGKTIIIYGDGEQTRSFTYVKDVVRANLIAADSSEMEGGYYNVASGLKISLNALINALATILHVKPKVEYQPARRGDIKYFDVDNTKITKLMAEPWTTGLRKTVEYYAKAA